MCWAFGTPYQCSRYALPRRISRFSIPLRRASVLIRSSFLRSAKLKKIPGIVLCISHLIKELFSKGGLAACRRADEQVKPGADAVQGPAEIGKSRFPNRQSL